MRTLEQRIIQMLIRLVLVLLSVASPVGLNPAWGDDSEVVLLTTTSTQDSGLLGRLVPEFERKTGYAVKVIAVGTGAALKQGAQGEGDVLLVHAPEDEERWMAKGFGAARRIVMFNDFVIVGPKGDPAKIRGLAPAEALRRIAGIAAGFASRGDQSGTHVREKAIWKQAGIDPAGEAWYVQTGLGQGRTLEFAAEQERYCLTDRGTFLVHEKRLGLEVLVENDPLLLNIYHVMEVNHERFPRVNAPAAKGFADFLVAPETQRIIGSFGVERFGRPLFLPAAGKRASELSVGGSSQATNETDWAYWTDLGDGFVNAIRLIALGDGETWRVIRQACLISFVATMLSIIIGVPTGTWLALAKFRGRGLLLTTFNTGFGLPPVVVGLILSILLLRHGPLGWLELRFTPTAVVIAQFLLSCPVVIGLTVAAIQNLNPKLRLQMVALGASRVQMFRLLCREARLPLLAAYMAGFGCAISEIGASLMVGGNLPGSTRTLTTAIVMETGMGNYDRAIAYGLILLALVFGIVGVLTYLQQREARL